MALLDPVGPLPDGPQHPPVPPDLLDAVTSEHRTWSARLALDPHDPYYYDHPLDHVPGMALVGGLLDLLHAAGLARADRHERWALDLRMPAFCEPDEPVRLSAEPADGAGLVDVRASQDDRVVCEGTVTVSAALPPRNVDSSPLPVPPPAPAALVHRDREENVLVSEMLGARSTTHWAAVLQPAPPHRLGGGPDSPLPAEAVIEAARQLTELISHVEHDVSEEDTFILLELRADLPGELHPGVLLRWRPVPAQSGRTTIELDIVPGDPAAEADGFVQLTYAAVAAKLYDRLRWGAQ
ncbi:MAG TPA: AfsA-related hotdog domain-containing protein [Mycobacteriales bacterium]|nr:AfsA-related hotdog domain-containing protein [Mycobacteriales bacterium]